MGLCQCCGFRGTEAHHITPLTYGGKDIPQNMMLLCYLCHRDAPDTKEEFRIYLRDGGARTRLMYGLVMQEIEKNNMNIGETWQLFRKIIKLLKMADLSYNLELYYHKSIELDLESAEI